MSAVAAKFAADRLRRDGLRYLRNREYSWTKADVRILLWQAQEGACLSCRYRLQNHLRYPRDGDRDTIDHVWPLTLGGRDAPGNLGLMHFKCNRAKDHRPPTKAELLFLELVNARLGWPNLRIDRW